MHTLSTKSDLARALVGTSLEGAAIAERWNGSSKDMLLVVDLPGDSVLESWQVLRSLVDVTGRFPLVTRYDDIDYALIDEPPEDHEIGLLGGYCDRMIDKARTLDGQRLLNQAGALGPSSPTVDDDLYGWLDRPVLEHDGHILGSTLRRFGTCPSADEIRTLHQRGTLRTNADLCRWLMRWELEHFGNAAVQPPSTEFVAWCDFQDGDRYVAVLPPSALSWEAFVFMGWYGSEERAAENAAALRAWHARYGAELVCSFSVTLQLQVARRPASLEEAFDLAIEHYHFASDAQALYGVSLGDYARTLFALDRWLFWAKP